MEHMFFHLFSRGFNSLSSAADESNKKLQQMEDAFEKLRSVTCVEKVDEMHEKFSMQKTNKLQLELEVRLVSCHFKHS